jgi:hypothetical protein
MFILSIIVHPSPPPLIDWWVGVNMSLGGDASMCVWVFIFVYFLLVVVGLGQKTPKQTPKQT